VEEVLGRRDTSVATGSKRRRLPKRVGQAAPAERDGGHDHGPPARVRGLEARFESRLLRCSSGAPRPSAGLLPELYLHGLAQGDFDLALRGLLGAAAPLSAPSIARLKGELAVEYESWKRRRLDNSRAGVLLGGRIYIKAGLEKAKAAMLVLIAALRDGRKVVLAGRAVSKSRRRVGPRCSETSRPGGCGRRSCSLLTGTWDLGRGGRRVPGGQRAAVLEHRLVNVLDTLPKPLQARRGELLTKIPYAETRAEAERQKRTFQAWATKKGVAAAGRRLDEDWGRLVTFYAFPKEHWKHLRTTNVVESPFATVRLRTEAAKRFKNGGERNGVIWKTLLVAEQRFRRLDAPEPSQRSPRAWCTSTAARKKRSNEKAAA